MIVNNPPLCATTLTLLFLFLFFSSTNAQLHRAGTGQESSPHKLTAGTCDGSQLGHPLAAAKNRRKKVQYVIDPDGSTAMLLDSRGEDVALASSSSCLRESTREHVSFRINGTFDETVSLGYLRGFIVPPARFPFPCSLSIPVPLSPTPPLGR